MPLSSVVSQSPTSVVSFLKHVSEIHPNGQSFFVLNGLKDVSSSSTRLSSLSDSGRNDVRSPTKPFDFSGRVVSFSPDLDVGIIPNDPDLRPVMRDRVIGVSSPTPSLLTPTDERESLRDMFVFLERPKTTTLSEAAQQPPQPPKALDKLINALKVKTTLGFTRSHSTKVVAQEKAQLMQMWATRDDRQGELSAIGCKFLDAMHNVIQHKQDKPSEANQLRELTKKVVDDVVDNLKAHAKDRGIQAQSNIDHLTAKDAGQFLLKARDHALCSDAALEFITAQNIR